MKIYKKLPVFIIIFVLIFGVQFIKPKKANAQFTDVLNTLKEFGIDTLVTILNNRVLEKLIDDTVNWAMGGFDGDPGYIDNWDGFLDGVKYDVIYSALGMATKSAYEKQKSGDEAGEEEKKQCLINVNTIYQNNLKKVEKSNAYRAYLIENYNGISDCSEHTKPSECFNDLRLKAIMAPYGINNVTTAEDVETQYIDEKEKCNYVGNIWGDVGNIAFNNWKNYSDTGIINARSIAATVANYGLKTLNENTLNFLIQGEGRTIDFLLGSAAAVENYKTDFKAGGWEGYMALADPHNTQSGTNSLITKVLSSKTDSTMSAVDKAVQDLQSNKYLGKKKCVEWEETSKAASKPAVPGAQTPKQEKKCLRYETVTPGSLVEDAMKDALGSDKQRSRTARELSDVLASALGKLTNKLIQAGVSKLKEKNKNGDSVIDTINNGVNDAFNAAYQNEYDVLGIADDARIFNQGGEENGNNSTTEGESTAGNGNYEKQTGGDSSVPYVGGPEDVIGQDWNSGPELIVELKGNLEKALNLTKQYLDLNLEISRKLKSTKENVAILDYCRPGPDFNWEKRYKDKADFIMDLFRSSKDDDDTCADFKYETKEKLFDIGLPSIKEMNADPYLNIPGANEITGIINEVAGDDNKELIKINKEAKQEKKVIYNILQRIRLEAEINAKFKKQIAILDNKITLFSDKIYKKIITEDENGKEIITKINILTDNDIKRILNIKVILDADTGNLVGLNKEGVRTKVHLDENGNFIEDIDPIQFDNEKMAEEYLIEYRNLYSFKDQTQKKQPEIQESITSIENIETPETLVLESRDKAEQLIIDLAWDIWRKSVNKDIKSNLRYQYYTIKNNLVTEQNILKLKIDSKNARENSAKIADYVLDCVSFLAKTKDKSDSSIKDYLESEYNKQQNNDPNNVSIFKTNLYTSPTNIQTSILKFVSNEDGETFDDYIEKVYPDRYASGFTFNMGEVTIKTYHGLGRSIRQILELDKTGRTVMLNMDKTIFDQNQTNLAIFQAVFLATPGQLLDLLFHGQNEEFNPNEGKELFCFNHTGDDFDHDSCVSGLKDYFICESMEGGSGNERWKPAQRWYFGKKITYSALFAGI